MSDDLKKKRYEKIQEQLKEMFATVNNPVSRMATIASVLHHKIKPYFFTGFFFVENNGDLVIGPYQGPTIQMLLPKGKGICQAAVEKAILINVSDVQQFSGYINCNEDTKSELVIPIKDTNGKIVAILDINSLNANGFDEMDVEELEKIIALIYN